LHVVIDNPLFTRFDPFPTGLPAFVLHQFLSLTLFAKFIVPPVLLTRSNENSCIRLLASRGVSAPGLRCLRCSGYRFAGLVEFQRVLHVRKYPRLCWYSFSDEDTTAGTTPTRHSLVEVSATPPPTAGLTARISASPIVQTMAPGSSLLRVLEASAVRLLSISLSLKVLTRPGCGDTLEAPPGTAAPDSECSTPCSKTGSSETCGRTADRVSVYEYDYTKVSGFLLVVMCVFKVCVLCYSVMDLDFRAILWNEFGWECRDWLVWCPGSSVWGRGCNDLLGLGLGRGVWERGDGFFMLRVVVPVEGECVVMRKEHGLGQEGFVTEELDQFETDCLLIFQHAFSTSSTQ